MQALDTNIVVRYLTGDDAEQAAIDAGDYGDDSGMWRGGPAAA